MSIGDANAIVAYLQKTPGWPQLGQDPAKAADLADKGYFVVAGKTETGHGHVAIVVPGWSSRGRPMAYWGRLKVGGRENASLSEAWMGEGFWDSAEGLKEFPHKKGTPAPLDQVIYFALPLATLNPVAKT